MTAIDACTASLFAPDVLPRPDTVAIAALSIGGVVRAAPPSWGRHPKTFTDSDMPVTRSRRLRELTALGYKTSLASSCRRNFLNYDDFYRSIGFGERLFMDDFPAPFDVNRFEATNSDALFLEAAINAYEKSITADATPRFLYALTNFNHGPYNRRLTAPGRFDRERAFAAASLPDPHYAEYYARLTETAVTWDRLKSLLSDRFPERPTLIVHYGDHQPVMTRQIKAKLQLKTDARGQFRTFYAMEALNYPIFLFLV